MEEAPGAWREHGRGEEEFSPPSSLHILRIGFPPVVRRDVRSHRHRDPMLYTDSGDSTSSFLDAPHLLDFQCGRVSSLRLSLSLSLYPPLSVSLSLYPPPLSLPLPLSPSLRFPPPPPPVNEWSGPLYIAAVTPPLASHNQPYDEEKGH